MKNLILGILIGVLLPFMIDFVLFGDFTPCQTITGLEFEASTSLQQCKVRR